MHTAAVIVSIHTIGITALGFRVSIPQILSAILAAAITDVAVTYRQSGLLVWPASGMLTGSGVALILRLVGMPSGDFWSWDGWYYFAGIAAVSVLTKYLIRFRGTHLFNPSNVGLVAGFLILGSAVIEPLDFWWAPLSPWMLLAYAVILFGGVVITRRLRLLATAVTFWVALAVGLGVLAASGHCMTAAWSVGPVCDVRFWTVLVTSPEVMVFLMFMITDPKTVPMGDRARLVYAGTLALAATLLIAPQSTEFGAKVGLLGSLVLWSPIRSLFDRYFAEPPSEEGWLEQIIGRGSSRLVFARGALCGSILGLTVLSIVLAGGPARVAAQEPDSTIALLRSVDVTAFDLPVVEVDSSVRSVGVAMSSDEAGSLAANLAENLAMETEAMRTADASFLVGAVGGGRLAEMQARLDEAVATGLRVTETYQFESLRLRAAERPDDQSGAALAFDGAGTVIEITFDAFGAEQGRREAPFSATFVIRQLGSDRWVITEVLAG